MFVTTTIYLNVLSFNIESAGIFLAKLQVFQLPLWLSVDPSFLKHEVSGRWLPGGWRFPSLLSVLLGVQNNQPSLLLSNWSLAFLLISFFWGGMNLW